MNKSKSGWGWFLFILGLIFTLGLAYAIENSKHKRDEEEARKKLEAEIALELQRTKEAEKAREAEDLRQKQLRRINSKLDSVRKAWQAFSSLIQLRNGYLAKFQMDEWKIVTKALQEELAVIPAKGIGLPKADERMVQEFLDYYKNSENYRNDFNGKFVENELAIYSAFFDSLESRKLDLQQRTAIITNDDNNLVIAGAGSGKTTTIVGKVAYLINRYKVAPERILLISFTNQSASTLGGRINIPGIEAKTFHKFGIDVICEVDGAKPSIFDSNQMDGLLRVWFKELLENSAYISKVTTFFADFLKLPKAEEDFNNQGELCQFLKDQNCSPYKMVEITTQGRRTYRREVVKSVEECKIANFLLFNSLEYEYEKPYEHETSTKAYQQYKPDFQINFNDKRIYLEHFALNRKGTVPAFFADAQKGESHADATNRYKEGIKWKRQLHAEHGTTMIETFSYEMKEGTLYGELEKKLKAKEVTLKRKSEKEIWSIIQEAAPDEIDGMIQLFKTFISLLKSNNYGIKDLVQKNAKTNQGFEKERNEKFIEIVSPLFERYQSYLKDRNEIDFSDMINLAAKYIQTGQYNKSYDYVVIDEFQDISIGRYQLVKALKLANHACRLFCVGDDWQSIYRFAGSDNSLFKEFEKYFGHTVKSKIEMTYRFHKPLLSRSSEFILKNPNQSHKNLKGVGTTRTTDLKIAYSSTGNQDDTVALEELLDELLATDPEIGKKEIMVLGRYSFDIKRIKNERGTFVINETTGSIQYKTLKSTFLTVHKAKGLEADIIIVINCNFGKYGFPSGMSDDPILNLLLSEADQFENGEERRLFYVAVTRAKEKAYLIADSYFKSKFINELEVASEDKTIQKCPRCVTADLVRKGGTTNGKQWAFWSCTNYLYGCAYQEWEK
jgi:DNA helicase IV